LPEPDFCWIWKSARFRPEPKPDPKSGTALSLTEGPECCCWCWTFEQNLPDVLHSLCLSGSVQGDICSFLLCLASVTLVQPTSRMSALWLSRFLASLSSIQLYTVTCLCYGQGLSLVDGDFMLQLQLSGMPTYTSYHLSPTHLHLVFISQRQLRAGLETHVFN